MASVQLQNISLSFGENTILSDISFTLATGERIALAGVNGSGKSTLMKVMAGLQQPDSGTITHSRGIRISYLPQSGVSYSSVSLMEEAEKAFDHLHSVEQEKQELEHQLGSNAEDNEHTHALIEKHHHLQELLVDHGFYDRKSEIEKVFLGLGFGREDLERNCDQFSGGWQMRIALGKILLEQPDILLLDEPTNYLDLEARTWLEQFLQHYPGGILVVSHDRFFLDTIVQQVYELFLTTLKQYRGNYTEYEQKRAQEIELLQKQYEEQQREIARIEEFINRFRYNASKAQLVQSRIKYLEKMERIQVPENMKKIHFSFPPAPHSGKQVLTISELSKAYGENTVLQGVDLSVTRGERVVVTGRNGIGKSTLLRIIAGEDDNYNGRIRYGTGVSVGYFAQDHEFSMDPHATVLEEVERGAPTQMIPQLRNWLGSFLFRGDDIYKRTAVLSGGEKSRLSLVKLLLIPHNLLVLDEPTNHLDIHSKDILLQSLSGFEGSIVFVSHDRYFIEHLATKVLELTPGNHRLFPGDYHYYLWKKEQEQEQAGQENNEHPSSRTPSMGKLDHEEEKKQRNQLKRLQQREEELMQTIERLDQEMHHLQQQLQDPAVYSDAEKAHETQQAIEQTRKKQEEAVAEWQQIDLQLANQY